MGKWRDDKTKESGVRGKGKRDLRKAQEGKPRRIGACIPKKEGKLAARQKRLVEGSRYAKIGREQMGCPKWH